MKKLLVIFLVGMLHLCAWEVKKGTETQLKLDTDGNLDISKGGLRLKHGLSFSGQTNDLYPYTFDVWIQGAGSYGSIDDLNPLHNFALLGNATTEILMINIANSYDKGVNIQSDLKIDKELHVNKNVSLDGNTTIGTPNMVSSLNVTGKVTSAQTVPADPINTLITKKYLTDTIAGITFQRDSCQWIEAVNVKSRGHTEVQCPSGSYVGGVKHYNMHRNVDDEHVDLYCCEFTVQDPNKCSFGLTEGQNKEFFQYSESPDCHSTSNKETRTCTNGNLSGSFINTSCTEPPVAPAAEVTPTIPVCLGAENGLQWNGTEFTCRNVMRRNARVHMIIGEVPSHVLHGTPPNLIANNNPIDFRTYKGPINVGQVNGPYIVQPGDSPMVVLPSARYTLGISNWSDTTATCNVLKQKSIYERDNFEVLISNTGSHKHGVGQGFVFTKQEILSISYTNGADCVLTITEHGRE